MSKPHMITSLWAFEMVTSAIFSSPCVSVVEEKLVAPWVSHSEVPCHLASDDPA